MSNVLLHTEDFTAVEWSNTGSTLTPNFYAPPTFAGQAAALGSKIQDADVGSVTSILQLVTIQDDSTDWLFSLYIHKDADSTAFPVMNLSFIGGGTPLNCYTMIDPVNGLLTDVSGQPTPAARGISDIDSNWWRVWIRNVNNTTGNTVGRVIIYPALSDSFGGGFNSPSVRILGGWGANLTNTTTLQTYDPSPFYVFTTVNPFFTSVSAKRMQ